MTYHKLLYISCCCFWFPKITGVVLVYIFMLVVRSWLSGEIIQSDYAGSDTAMGLDSVAVGRFRIYFMHLFWQPNQSRLVIAIFTTLPKLIIPKFLRNGRLFCLSGIGCWSHGVGDASLSVTISEISRDSISRYSCWQWPGCQKKGSQQDLLILLNILWPLILLSL